MLTNSNCRDVYCRQFLENNWSFISIWNQLFGHIIFYRFQDVATKTPKIAVL